MDIALRHYSPRLQLLNIQPYRFLCHSYGMVHILAIGHAAGQRRHGHGIAALVLFVQMNFIRVHTSNIHHKNNLNNFTTPHLTYC